MKLIVGLGNPGKDYARTRHNIGFELLDALAAAQGRRIESRRDRALTAHLTLGAQPVLLAKPLTFMNLSGDAVAALVRKEGIALPDLLVVCDDVHLPVGRIRLRAKGSSGGQNGLKHIGARLGTDDWARLRIGVGEAPPGQQIDWVLSRFSPADRKTIDQALLAALAAVEVWATEGIEAAMNRFNGVDWSAAPPG